MEPLRMKMIPSDKILSVNSHEDLNDRVGGSAWFKMYDTLYDDIWNYHIFIWYQIDGALHNNLREPGVP